MLKFAFCTYIPFFIHAESANQLSGIDFKMKIMINPKILHPDIDLG